MRVVRADFAEPRRAPSWVWNTLIGLLLIAVGYQSWIVWTLKREVDQRLEAEEQRQLAERAKLSQLPAPTPPEPPYAEDAMKIAKLAEFPLNSVFASIESARVAGIRMTALDISAADGTVRAEVEFSEFATLLRYVDELNAGEPVRRWILVNAQVSLVPTAPNTAVISSSWSGDSK